MAANSRAMGSIPPVETDPMVQRQNIPIKPIDWVLILLVGSTWGLTFVGIKETVHNAPPLQASGIRFMLASLPLLVVALLPNRRKMLKPIDYAKFAVVGLLQTSVMFGLIYTVIPNVSAGMSSIIINTNPFFVAILAHFMIKGDGLTPQKIGGLIVGFSGVVVLVLGGKGLGASEYYWPLLLVVASVIWGFTSVLVKLFQFKDMVCLTAWQSFFGSLPMLVIGFGFDNQQAINWNLDFVFWTFYTAIISSSFGWWAWYRLLQTYNASRISVSLFLVPVCGVISGVIFYNEPLGIAMIVGGSLVIAGIILVNLRLSKAPSKQAVSKTS
jgi:O-acetylserine/cysteine efflux transporter